MTDREIAEALYEKIKQDKKVVGLHYGSICYLEIDAIKTAYRLLQNDKDSPIYAYVCRDYLHHLHGGDSDFYKVMKEVYVEFKKLKDKGVEVPDKNMEYYELNYKSAIVHDEEQKKIEENAEKGLWDERLRPFLEGFDLIQGKIGSFHDSEVVGFDVHQSEDYADLKLHMCNGVNLLVIIRFEKYLEYNVCASDTDYLDFGYFTKSFKNWVELHLDPYGDIIAERARVICVKPWNDEVEREYEPWRSSMRK